MGKLTIAFDFDDTISADPKTFCTVMKQFQSAGHTVIICTARWENADHMDIMQFIRRFPKPPQVVFTSGQGKVRFCAQAGIKVNIFIDDFPELLAHDIDEARKVRSKNLQGCANPRAK